MRSKRNICDMCDVLSSEPFGSKEPSLSRAKNPLHANISKLESSVLYFFI